MRGAFDVLGGWALKSGPQPGLPQGGLWDSQDAGDDAHGDTHERARFRAVFISDLHLGTAGCQARPLLDFLKHHPSHTLYLVGDIIDGWQLRRKWYWPQAHNDVIQKLLRRSRKGCRVVFVPGNHDEFARQFDGHNFGGIEVANEAVHTTADGRRLWVVHGDYFDGVIQCAKWLAYLGDNAYEFTLKLNRHLNSLRARMGLPYWSLSQYLKHKVKSALNYVTDFERAVAAEARQRGYQGVVCGHIHRPEMRTIDGTLYCNDGDWVESLSALVEHMDGRLELVHWSPQTAAPVGAQGDKHEDPDRDGRLATAGEFGRHHTG
ncbi:UDP-2,3-diacylglucosamine diphosphatase [Hydrogenophaga sp.]|uniref:UDP-2,3-diacylglucosamine diphosphatase n=1 Tax=Hydrogenophaga sp. TaxID=1904254 RepID=UPI0027349C4F|nr:UDP-2,3-diacylglucosamine diphosphatase [Hydrogenophaga sp.]MDP2988424.1 UDP-2,3-diacylglucosamine diphosphatase [Hydrogenophaga sp.]